MLTSLYLWRHLVHHLYHPLLQPVAKSAFLFLDLLVE